jgi:hypothetical protein
MFLDDEAIAMTKTFWLILILFWWSFKKSIWQNENQQIVIHDKSFYLTILIMIVKYWQISRINSSSILRYAQVREIWQIFKLEHDRKIITSKNRDVLKVLKHKHDFEILTSLKNKFESNRTILTDLKIILLQSNDIFQKKRFKSSFDSQSSIDFERN